MKRRLLKLAVFLLLGAIVNVAVAWGCGCLSVPDGHIYLLYDGVYVHLRPATEDQSWLVRRVISLDLDRFKRWGNPIQPCVITSIQGPGIRSFQLRPDLLPPRGNEESFKRDTALWLDGLEWEAPHRKIWFATFSAQGWPCVALWYGEFENGKLDGGWLLSREQKPGYLYYNRALAFRPIWPGFAINTVFYAVVLWLLFAGPFVVRRWRRIRRGLCPKCAYDLRGSADTEKCPECGATR